MNKVEKRILLVEDNPMDVDLTLRAFKQFGRQGDIILARDGEEVVACMAKWEEGAPTPCYILLDLKIPKISGLEVLEKLKTHNRFRSIPVIILSTSSNQNDVGKAYYLGANSYILKPLDFEKFKEIALNIDQYWHRYNIHNGFI